MFREVVLQANSDAYVYREEDKIGEGGFGSVYLGKGLQSGVPVAIKRPHFYSDDALKRFKYKDCRYLPQLRHPYIVSVMAVLTEVRNAQGELGPPALIMEYVTGKNLETSWAEYIRFLSHFQKLELFKKICEGVNYAHGQGIIHRDLKPGNILLDAQHNPKIIDFGLAASLKPEELRSISGSQQFMGSLLYMAPEQYDAKYADERADIYSLGLVLFFIFTGWHAKALLLKGEDTLTQMSDKYLPVEVAGLVKHACELDRKRRLHSSRELVDRLGELLSCLSLTGSPLASLRPPIGPFYRLTAWRMALQREGVALSLGAMLGLVIEQSLNQTALWLWVTAALPILIVLTLLSRNFGDNVSANTLPLGKTLMVAFCFMFISAFWSDTGVWNYLVIVVGIASIAFWGNRAWAAHQG